MAGPIYNPGEPYMMQIPGGFSPGRIAHITGTFTPTATSFILKFQSGPSGDPADEIGLCMYGRVAEGIIGRNAFTRAAGWGQEEATNSIALARGQNFDVTIMCDPMQFKIALNGQHFADFNHRTNPATLTFVNVGSTTQDMHLACVWIEDTSPVAPPTQAPFTQAPAYAPAPNYGPQPPYSGGPGYAPQYPQGPPPGQYGAPHPPHSGGSGSSKGLMGMVAGAGTAVAGALGASHLIGKAKGGGYPGHGGGYGGGYPGHGGGYGGGYPGHGSGGGGMLNKVMQTGGALGAAKMASKPSGLLKYGAPLAGLGALGAGGYMMSKGLGGMGGFHCGGSSSSGGSSEEEE